MGNSTSRVVGCFAPADKAGVDLDFLEPLDEGLGHSFCYVRPGAVADSPAITPSNSERYTLDSSVMDSETRSGSFRQDATEDLAAAAAVAAMAAVAGLQRPSRSFGETTFRTISGASVSANASSARTGNLSVSLAGEVQEPAAAFESTASFTAVPLQPVPRGSGPLNTFLSGPLERGFASGPLDKGSGFMSGPLDKGAFMSGPIDGGNRSNFSAPLSYGRRKAGLGHLVHRISRPMKTALSRTFSRNSQNPGWVHKFLLHPMAQLPWARDAKSRSEGSQNGFEAGLPEPEYNVTRNLQWAHGKAGEDRVHVVLSEEQGWLFIGIYDGFSGPDAPDFLMSNLYKAIDKELEGLLWIYEETSERSDLVSNHEEGEPVAASMDVPHGDGGQLQIECVKQEQLGNFEKHNVSAVKDCDENALQVQPNSTSNEHKDSATQVSSSQELVADEIVEETAEADLGNDLQSRESHNLNSGLSSTDLNISCSCTAENSVYCDQHAKFLKVNRKSKRLFELLDMELLGDHDRSVSKASPEGRKTQSSHNMLAGTTEGSSRNAADISRCSLATSGECFDDSEDLGSSRHADTVLGCDPKECSECSISTSSSGHKQITRRFLFGSKLRKMYKKQKLLQKKFFLWNYDWHRDQPHVDESVIQPSEVIRRCKSGPVEHDAVLRAMSRALETTEEAYMEIVEKELDRHPELALMGSCVLVMLMKDQDVYVMNLGDSRVILAQDNDQYNSSSFSKGDLRHRNRSRESLVRVELDRISEESPMHNPNSHLSSNTKAKELSICRLKMRAVQLSTDHSTSIEQVMILLNKSIIVFTPYCLFCDDALQEVLRIKAEHPDDPQAVFNDRVKGQLKVTRAFGAGFLKKPRFNEALLQMFRIDYVGTSPYISCAPAVLHHRLCTNDRFLVLSSDGLYQYFSNDEVVSHVLWFMENVPEGDPAQYLVAELLCRAAKKNGQFFLHTLFGLYSSRMDFHELLDIPQGDRRKYHDDVSVMVISLEGRIWRSSG
ncbi:Protein phosphatase 2C 32 [Dichanthelium oligosanthes]|uniref:protein-serine/threonine phosphatase n=1 Tax=Dichanthelium oligosanthes TaxID=888268 RepID=A0A1E5VWQ7_9POAL|nr:Protein phosphatase 2C 32 [Dichanthelium oligosanthes]